MIKFIKEHLQTIVTLGSVIGAMVMWFVTMSNLPARVENLAIHHNEDFAKLNSKVDDVDLRLRVAEINIEKNAIKADMTLNGIEQIRQILLTAQAKDK